MLKLKKEEDLHPLEQLALVDMSYSRLNTYAMCPAMYFHTYIEKQDRLFGPAASLGTIIHSVLEDHVGQELDYQQMIESFFDHKSIEDPDGLIDDTLVQTGQQVIYEFYERHKEDTFNVVGKEVPFSIVIGSGRIRGFIDLVVIGEGGKINVIDWKAQPLDASILTPAGWTRMGDVNVGDEVIGGNGSRVTVTGVYPQGVVPAYRVSFTDGSSTICSDSHLWQVTNLYGSTKVMTTQEIASSKLRQGWNYAFAIPTVDPVEFNKQPELPIDPYIMGVILGDGGTTSGTIKIHAEDDEILERVSRSLPEGLSLKWDYFKTYRISSSSRRNIFTQALKEYGLMGCRSWEKFIPEAYLRASVDDRYALLQGLMDTDGGSSTRTAFVTTSPALRDGIMEVIRSLGGLPMSSEHASFYRDKNGEKVLGRTEYVINTRMKENPFHLSRKRAQFKERKQNDARRIKSIERIPDLEMQCIQVDAEDGLYVTDDYIVTHNSGKYEITYKNAPSDLQLGIYALAMADAAQETDIYAEVYYLRTARRKGHLFTEKDIQRVYDRVLLEVNTVINDRFFHPTKDPSPCRFCDFRKNETCKTGMYRFGKN